MLPAVSLPKPGFVLRQSEEFRRGWGALIACLCGTACGILSITFYTQGLFAQAVTTEFGWQRGDFFLGFTVMQLSGLLTAPAIGVMVDKIGPRIVGIIGLIGHGLMYCVLAINNGSQLLWLLSFVGLAICAAGTLPITWTTVVNSWFVANRGLAIGLTMAGTGLAAALAPPYVQYLLTNFGWRWAYAGIGITAMLLALPIVLRLFYMRPEFTASHRDPQNELLWGLSRKEALRSFRFWTLGSALLIITLALIGMIPNFVPLLIDSGISAERAASIAGLMGIAVIAGRLLAGYLVDRVWAPAIAAVFFIMPVLALLVLAFAPISETIALLAGIGLGLAAGAELDLLAFLTSRYFGLRHYGAVFGGIYAFFTVGSGLAPLVYARSFDSLGSYQPILPIAAAALTLAIVLLLTLGRYPRPAD